MTQQETFDLVCAHLRKQGRPSRFTRAGPCRYRGPAGLKCAVGWLIPDEMYKPVMESYAASDLLVRDTLERLGHNISLCLELQIIHDRADDDEQALKKWEPAWRDLAGRLGLVYTPPAA